VTVFNELVAEAKRTLDAERIPADRRVVELSLDVRYYGQTPYINLLLAEPPATEDDLEDVLRRYEESYLREFGYMLPRSFATIEVVNARVAAIGLTDKAKLTRRPERGESGAAHLGTRPVYFERAGDFVETALYDRALLRNGAELAGPAIVEQADSTLVLPPGASALVDEYLSIVVSVDGR
jgi:N-methylhydantoinase A